MPLLEGCWAWVNNFAPNPRVDRAKAAALKGMIVKYGMVAAERAYTEAGIPWATEGYVLPKEADAWGQKLANAVNAGAVAAVINAEVEWESQPAAPMERLIATFRARHPAVELYASVDTRGNRLQLPYQQVLRQHIAGWLPMIYPLSFRPARYTGFVGSAFRDCLDGKDFGGIPVYPTIQTYDGIGQDAVAAQIMECKRRGLTGYQSYTIAHATDDEWIAIVADRPEEEPVTLFTKAQQAAIANVLLNLGQPAPLTTAVSVASWGQAWEAFFDAYNVPEDQRIVPPQPKINQTFAGDFSINVVRGYIRTGDDIRWVW